MDRRLEKMCGDSVEQQSHTQIHASTHILRHAYIYLNIPKHTYTCASIWYKCMHTHINIYSDTYICMHMHTCVYTHPQACTHMYTHMHTHTCTYICMHTFLCIHTYKYTHTYAYIYMHLHTWTDLYNTYICTHIYNTHIHTNKHLCNTCM